MSFSSRNSFKNSSNPNYFLTFRQRCSLRSFWVYWRARAPSGSEKRSRWKLSQNWPKFRKRSFWFQIVVKKWFWFYKMILQVILIIYNPSLGTFRYQKFGGGVPPPNIVSNASSPFRFASYLPGRIAGGGGLFWPILFGWPRYLRVLGLRRC